MAKSPSRNDRERPYRIDPDDEEYIKDLQRPAVIKADLSEMERRKKVHELLESKGFCRQLEMSMRAESDELSTSLHGHLPPIHFPTKHSRVPPIADLLDGEFTSNERQCRSKLACFLRVIENFRWSSSFNAHVSLRLSDSQLLTQPIGLFYNEIRASSLLKVDLNGTILHQGITRLGISEPNFSLHSSIFSWREDVQCIAHLQSPIITAVSSLKCGLLPICPEATFLGAVGYFDFFGTLSEDDSIRLQAAVENVHVLVVRNNGIIAMGGSVEETALYASHIFTTCETQIRAAKAGIENIHVPSTSDHASEVNGNTELNEEVEKANEEKRLPSGGYSVGTIEWESFMRVLDTKGLGTGHVYRMQFDSADAIPNDAIDQLMTASSYRKSMSNKWLSSPIKYQRVDFLEKGTVSPKKITKWIADAHNPSQSGNAVKISTVHQFAPLSPTTNDFKAKQRLLKETRITGDLNAGPQSNIMNGLYTETDGSSQIPDDRSVLIGTASRGIIERDYRCHAQVYRQLYAANPFREQTNDELDRYFKEVEKRSSRSKSCDPAVRASTLRMENVAEQPSLAHFFEGKQSKICMVQSRLPCSTKLLRLISFQQNPRNMRSGRNRVSYRTSVANFYESIFYILRIHSNPVTLSAVSVCRILSP
ncbi:hypothetical protein PENTCL1PPCAC_30060 [Pristionchus entomophagus]|uniref:Class II aldolase/adducin N-terminal domain-containing protein n=1 Tax=Pristionchus entomophagus TaxID=358040 RepID=A0AAV5ULA0_9BILA|nr:hypothetical protein PENTCL1PPCAC_30060 [Pristionchus entomophagus]